MEKYWTLITTILVGKMAWNREVSASPVLEKILSSESCCSLELNACFYIKGTNIYQKSTESKLSYVFDNFVTNVKCLET